jgi:hypothetical protein
MIKRLTYIFIFILLAALPMQLFAQTTPKIQKKAKIEWERIDAASGYIIEIRQGGTKIIESRTKNNYYEADLSHGVYQFRISVLDKNNQVAVRTNWKTVKVQSWSIVGEKYQFIALGWNYNIIVPKWNELVEPSLVAFHLFYEYETPIDFLGVGGLIEFEEYDNIENSGEVSRDISLWSFSPGVTFYSKLSEYFDGLFHFHTGLSYATLNIDDRGTKGTYNSLDFLLQISLGLRIAYDMYFIEHGIGYKEIYFQSEPFREARPYIRAGVRF